MLTSKDIYRMYALFANGKTIRQISEMTGYSRATVSRHVREGGTEETRTKHKTLEPHREFIVRAFFASDGNCHVVQTLLEKERNVRVSTRTIRRFCEEFRPELERVRRMAEERYEAYLDTITRSGKPVSAAQQEVIRQLSLKGYQPAEISRTTGHSLNTVKKYLGLEGPREDSPARLLARYRDWLLPELVRVNGNFAELYRRFTATFGVQVNMRSFRRHVMAYREEAYAQNEARYLAEQKKRLAEKAKREKTE